MNKRDLINLIDGFDDKVIIDVKDPNAEDVTWYSIKGVDMTIEEGNEFGQVVLILHKEPVMS